jgi:hypothetical protein
MVELGFPSVRPKVNVGVDAVPGLAAPFLNAGRSDREVPGTVEPQMRPPDQHLRGRVLMRPEERADRLVQERLLHRHGLAA